MAHQLVHMKIVRARMLGRSVHIPTYCAKVPINQGKRAPPTTLVPISKPIVLGTKELGTRRGTTAIIEGKRGPRKKPIRQKPRVADCTVGKSQTSSPPIPVPIRE